MNLLYFMHNMKYLSVCNRVTVSMQPGYRKHKINWETDFHGHIEGGLDRRLGR